MFLAQRCTRTASWIHERNEEKLVGSNFILYSPVFRKRFVEVGQQRNAEVMMKELEPMVY